MPTAPEEMTLKVIAHIHTAFPTKFGIPRQSGLVDSLRRCVKDTGKICMHGKNFAKMY